MHTNDFTLIRSGKVRDVYAAGDDYLIVSSDRISAFDCILPTPIPDKGKVLTQLSVFWFERTSHIIRNHIIAHRPADFSSAHRPLPDEWYGRSLLVKKASVIPVECVVRGYLAGSGLKDYRDKGSICGIALPSGLAESEKLPAPLFTPSSKADIGHDEPIDFDQVVRICGTPTALRLREVALALYIFAAAFALQRGVIIADTKFEFGLVGEELILIDEIFTPDSSRFWDAATYSPGRPQDSFDKQYVRDYLETVEWDKTDPAPALPPEVARRTALKYQEAYDRLTGLEWPAVGAMMPIT